MRVAVGMLMLVACVWPLQAQETDPTITTFSNTDAEHDTAPDVVETPPVTAPVISQEENPIPDPISDTPIQVENGVEQLPAIIPPSEAGTKAVEALNNLLDGQDAAADPDTALSSMPDPSETILDAFFSMLRGLAIVLALILLAYYLVRRFGRKVPALAGTQLGSTMGVLHLSKDSSLHYVNTGGRVLVIGVNPNSMSLIAEFDAIAFDDTDSGESTSGEFSPDSFLAQLKTQSSLLTAAKQDEDDELSDIEDDDITALRGDIHRLQQYLRDESRGSGDSNI